jgi:integrase
MSEVQSTGHRKPSKPYPDFPLFPHATGRWAKKIRGKFHYFGPWADPDAALAKYLDEKDALHAGRKPRPGDEALTVKALCNAFLNHKQAQLDSGEISPRTFTNAKQVTDLLVYHFGKHRVVTDLRPDDFGVLRKKMAKKWGPVRVRDFVQRVRSVFKFGFDLELVDTPVRFGPGFARPSKKTIRLARANKGPRMFEAAELRRILEAAGIPLKAMILLGVNAGYGNADCGTLPRSALDLDVGWVNYHRPKTGITRRCPLWPATVSALREALAARPKPKQAADAGLVFLTARGASWHKKIEDNPISKEMRKLLDALGINGSRNFYALRHTLETIGGEAKDQVALDHIMGHARDDMASVYRERIGDERLKAVTDHVRKWLFAEPVAASPPA